ncbi:MAG: BlaI/MecI/CopY family transcriptional regulator [Saprospiraceae bacterium]
MTDQNIKPTQSEFEILQVLWKLGPSTVKRVNEALNEKKPKGYTTTLKIMQIMAEKALVTRVLDGKFHIYTASHKELQVKKTLVSNIVDQVFEGAAMELVIQTLGNYKPSPLEIIELKELIAQYEKTKN